MNITVKLYNDKNIKFYGSNQITIDLEEYLVGCVAAEIGNAPLEACKAQAVASRTFALNAIKSKGYITDKSSSDQAFRSERLTGYPNVIQAVKDTEGEVLYYNNKLAKAYYSASNGGYMISAKTRWGGDYPYLISQKDEYDNGKGNGYGVGLSQNSTINRAKAGFNYQQIISFFFPGTKILSLKEDEFYEVFIKCKNKKEAENLIKTLKNGEIVCEKPKTILD